MREYPSFRLCKPQEIEALMVMLLALMMYLCEKHNGN